LPDAVTQDALLDGAVLLRQPEDGYRAAIDSVFLAAAVPAESGARVFEPGAGVGAAALCLARRAAGCNVTGIELQPDLVRLAGENVRANGMVGRVDIMIGDLAAPLPPRIAGPFDHVMANPPHLEEGRARKPPDPGKAAAQVEAGARLADWIDCCLMRTRSRGTLTMIHRADRLDEILGLLRGRGGEIVVFPLWPGRGDAPAKRVIVRARRAVATPLRLAPGMVLHEADGRFTPEAEAVLRGGPLVI